MEPRQFEIRSSSNSFASYKNVCAVRMSFFQQDGAFTAPWPVSSAEGVLGEFLSTRLRLYCSCLLLLHKRGY